MKTKCEIIKDKTGKIKGINDKRTLYDLIKMNNNPKGYTKVSYKNKTYDVHKIISNYIFKDVPRNYLTHHIDENKKNNNPNNLLPVKRSTHSKEHKYGL